MTDIIICNHIYFTSWSIRLHKAQKVKIWTSAGYNESKTVLSYWKASGIRPIKVKLCETTGDIRCGVEKPPASQTNPSRFWCSILWSDFKKWVEPITFQHHLRITKRFHFKISLLLLLFTIIKIQFLATLVMYGNCTISSVKNNLFLVSSMKKCWYIYIFENN